MFFERERLHFFKPLTSKYRQQVLECLCLLHERLYGATAEYGQSLGREQVLDVFEEAVGLEPEYERHLTPVLLATGQWLSAWVYWYQKATTGLRPVVGSDWLAFMAT